jgi:two-component system, NarL family, sensor histidine kinase DesK
VNDTALIEAAGFPLWAARRAVWFLVAIHLPFVAYIPITLITREPGRTAGGIALIVLAAAAVGGLQLRHSLAAARGERPRAWPLTFAALVVLAYLPAWSFASPWFDWAIPMQWFVIGSAVMLLPRRLAALAVTAAVAGNSLAYGVYDHRAGFAYPQTVLFICYYVAVLVLGGGALYGSARLVSILGDLFAARAELAENALARERLRMSRDLHDLLGQSLSAVSLKGDLAIRLLPSDPAAAYREIESLTGVARSALRDMRAVARGEHDVSLPAEVDSAQAILEAAGVATQVAVALPGLSPALDAVLAWGIREGTTNILRHSQATAAVITAGRADGLAWLEIVNDAAQPAADSGSGLAGLAGRARALGGTAIGGNLGAGTFRLRIELPEGAQ